jgi:hypothetical protein
VTGLEPSVRALQTELTELSGEILALEIGPYALGIAVAGRVTDLIAVNVDMSVL